MHCSFTERLRIQRKRHQPLPVHKWLVAELEKDAER